MGSPCGISGPICMDRFGTGAHLNEATISASAPSSGEPPTRASRRRRMRSYSAASSFIGRLRAARTCSRRGKQVQ